MLPRIVLVDANVFFSPRMRDLVMHLHAAEILHVHWTREIEAEWTRNVVAKQDAQADAIQACLRGMRDAVDGWEVAGHSRHEARFLPVDAKDRHVAAAAYKLSLDDWPGQPVALLTKNLKDFPPQAFADTQVTCWLLGDYIDALFAAEPASVAKVAEQCRKKLKHPPLTREGYVAVLMLHGCRRMALALGEQWSVECPQVAANGTLFYASEASGRKSLAGRTAKKITP
jgi:hypothetical protein